MENKIEDVPRDVGGFAILYELAKGNFGTVYLCQEKLSKKYLAIKSIRCTSDTNLLHVEEANLIKKLQHPFILSGLHTFTIGEEILIVMDLMLGDMANYLSEKTLSESESLFYDAELVSAVIHIHSLHIVHRDITLRNIMLSPMYDIKLGDFGLSQVCGNGLEVTPDLIPHFQYGKVHDWRSVGVCLHKMMLGVFPWDSPQQHQKEITENAGALLTNLSDSNYLEQLNSADMQNHICFKDVDWDKPNQGKLPRPVPEYSQLIIDFSKYVQLVHSILFRFTPAYTPTWYISARVVPSLRRLTGTNLKPT